MPFISRFATRPTKLLCTLFILLFNYSANAQMPNVVASIKPLHSLLSNIMQGTNKPELLIADNQSIHDYQLRPSQRRMLAHADWVFYASNHVESFMPALQSSISKTKFINLSSIKGLQLLPSRTIETNHPHHHADADGHIWLAPANAKIIAQFMSQQLSKRYPEYADIYQQNLARLLKRLTNLQRTISQQLKPFNQHHYLLFHDALQYFEHEFGLNNGRFVTSSANHKMGIKYVSALKKMIIKNNIRCIYYEPPHIPKLIYRLTQQQPASLLPLDPLALQYNAGTELYFKSLKHIATQFESCLGANE